MSAFLNEQCLQFAVHSRALLVCVLLDVIHPLHLGELHLHTPTNAQLMYIRARVDAVVTTTLRKVTVLTAHPNSFPLSSHRSEPSGQILGFEMGVRRGQVTGLAMQVEDCSCQHLESTCRSKFGNGRTIGHQLQW